MLIRYDFWILAVGIAAYVAGLATVTISGVGRALPWYTPVPFMVVWLTCWIVFLIANNRRYR